MRHKLWCASLVLLLSAPGWGADVILIRAGRLIDPDTGQATAKQEIVIEAGKIKAVGSGLPAPAGASVIDLSDRTVVPGLMDCHTHLCTPPLRITPALAERFPAPVRWEAQGWPLFFLTTLLNPTGYRAIVGVANARDMLEAGFTTVRDLGHAGNYADTDLRRAVEEGLVPGPTILNSGKKICAYGGQFTLQPETREQVNNDYIFAESRDEMRKAIRENIHYGARVIKIVAAGQRYQYGVDDIRFIVEEAGRWGLKVSADCSTRSASRSAAEAGVASIEHTVGMQEEDFAVARKNNAALMINVPPAAMFQEGGFPPEARQPMIEHLRRAFGSGATLAFGTDVAFRLRGQNHGQIAISFLETYVDAGMPAPEILKTITSNAARLLGVEKERGAIKPGLAADLVAVAGNPLEDIQTLKRVTFVMKEGRVIRNNRGRE